MKYRIIFISIFFVFNIFCFSQTQKRNNKSTSKSNHTYSANSVLSKGSWFKISVKNDGIYKITYNDLLQYGIDPNSIDPRNIRIYGNGGGMLPEYNLLPNYDDLIENAICVAGEADGHFDVNDYILFYAQSPVKWTYDTVQHIFTHQINYYSDESCYFINTDIGPGKRINIQNSSSLTPTHIYTTFNDYIYHEKDTINLLKSGKEWYGEYFNSINYNYSFNFIIPNINKNYRSLIRTNIVAANTINTQFNLSADGNSDTITVQSVSGSSSSDYAKCTIDTMSFLPSGSSINVALTMATSSSLGWLNYFELNVVRNLTFTGQQMLFRNSSSFGKGNISEFKINNINPNIQIWNVSDPFNIKNQQYISNSDSLYFILPTDTLKQFIAFDFSSFYNPVFEGKVLNQNLHGLGSTDFIIITHPNFISQANQIATIHSTFDNFSSIVVTPQQIFNEFSSGTQDVAAMRNFIRMLYDRFDSLHAPRYLLLLGSASYDYKNHFTSNTNLVPTYESNNSLTPTASYVTDDFFGLLDSTSGYFANGDLDIGIGRMPIQTVDEANAMVNKIEAYLYKKSLYTETNGCTTFNKEIPGDWRNVACFIADAGNNDLHIGQAEGLVSYVDTANINININKIYLDAFVEAHGPSGNTYPDVNKAITKQVQDGAVMINYTGHGGEEGLSAEYVLTISDILNWTNILNMPVFVTATCEFSTFDDPEKISAGEDILLNPVGGAIAMFTTTRVSLSNTNFGLNKSFCKFAFKKVNGSYQRFGDIIRLSKIDNGSIVNNRNFVLLGDPALRLAIPENTVVTKTINGLQSDSISDTIKALNEVTVTGFIQNTNGQKMSNFNGKIYPTVFDKPYLVTTLSNDQDSPPYNFYMQDRILYKGVANVFNGNFSFSFILPKDMSIIYGNGKISYYAKDSTVDATGFYEGNRFIIGGVDTLSENDITGPSVNLYMNNTNFIQENIIDKNPVMLAFLADSNGINNTGNDFGHDITAVLDGNASNTINLNDYYIPDANTFTKGIVAYPFVNLSEGLHTLKIKAWDMCNNSTEDSIKFIVSTPSSLALKNIYNFPNPFTDKTGFYFEHNQPCCELDVEINIYSINGIHVKTIHQTVPTINYSISPIEWNGRNDAGVKIESGVYIYNIKVLTTDGSYLESSNKLIILK